MRYFCTYFDERYVPNGLALYDSLRKHCPEFTLWILCLDRTADKILSALNLSQVRVIHLEELERAFPALLEAKANRSVVEYYFTCTPFLPLFLLERNPAIDLITYLDADLFFFSSVEPLFKEIGDHSIAIIAHKFPEQYRDAERFGIFNVGWLSFRRDPEGLLCLERWRNQCLKWCDDRCDGDRFADQKYLDDWPSVFPNLVVLQHKGANLAPWNLANYEISCRGKLVYVDDDPLLFFHFQGLKKIGRQVYDPQFDHYAVRPSEAIVRQIYAPYVRRISRRGARRRGYGRQPLRSVHAEPAESNSHLAFPFDKETRRRLREHELFFVVAGRIF